MQIVRTEILRPAEGGSAFRVRFCGDGDEHISVQIPGDQHEGDAEVLARAKTLLLQTVNFGLAANEYDAQSNGDFDEVAVTTVAAEDGAVFIFECRDGEGSRQLPPSRLASLDAARAEALRCAIDLLGDRGPDKEAITGWLVRVLSESGELHWVIDAQDVEATQGSASARHVTA